MVLSQQESHLMISLVQISGAFIYELCDLDQVTRPLGTLNEVKKRTYFRFGEVQMRQCIQCFLQ